VAVFRTGQHASPVASSAPKKLRPATAAVVKDEGNWETF